jgi:RNA polymerase sigma-70 factor (ECF subfamily)
MSRIARNLLIDNVRRRAHDALIHASSGRSQAESDALERLAGEVIPPEQGLHACEFAALVDELLAEIPDDQRQTFTLHHYSGLSLLEVSEIMDVPLATCKSRLRLAREKMAEKLRARGLAPACGEQSPGTE